jgi:hypothetical protein
MLPSRYRHSCFLFLRSRVQIAGQRLRYFAAFNSRCLGAWIRPQPLLFIFFPIHISVMFLLVDVRIDYRLGHRLYWLRILHGLTQYLQKTAVLVPLLGHDRLPSQNTPQCMHCHPNIRRYIGRLDAGVPPRRQSNVTWDLWWTKWHLERVFTEYFDTPCHFSFHQLLHIHWSFYSTPYSLKVNVMLQATVSRPVYLGVKPHLAPNTRFLLLSDSCGFVDVHNCCWSSPAQSFSGPSPAGLMTILYCFRFETVPTWRARSPYLYPPGTGWPSYTPMHWVPFSSPPTTRRATVEAFEPASTLGIV